MAKCLITVGQEYLQPMYEFFHRKLLKRRFLMMGETPVQVLNEEDRRDQTKSYFWVIRIGEDGQEPINLYNYTPIRAGENAKRFLEGIREKGPSHKIAGSKTKSRLLRAFCCG